MFEATDLFAEMQYSLGIKLPKVVGCCRKLSLIVRGRYDRAIKRDPSFHRLHLALCGREGKGRRFWSSSSSGI